MGKDGPPFAGDFSVCVTDAKTVKTDSLSENIRTNLLLPSDLKGYIHNPGYYFLDDSPARRHYLDLVMMTHGWRRFKTDDLFNPEPFMPKHYIERGQYISGHVKTLGNKDAKLAQVDALAINRRNVIGNAVTDSAGYFTMEGLDFQDTTVFILFSRNKRGKIPYNVNVETPYPRPAFKPIFPFLSEKQRQLRNDDLQRYLASFPKTNTDGVRVYEIEEVTVTARNPNRPPVSIAGNVYDDTARIAKFGTTPLEHFIKFLPRAEYSNGRIRLRLPDGAYVPAQIKVNNEIVYNLGYLNRFQVSEVEYICVVIPAFKDPTATEHAIFFSDYPYRIEILLKKDAKGGRDFSVYRTIGYSENAEFYHPVYDIPEKINSKTPDLRTSLYWNPYLQTGPDGKAAFEFYSADDDTPKYEITIEGITPGGNVCRYQQQL